MQRITIIGSTGSGKSTLARQLSEILELEWFSIDENFWKPNWVEGDHDEVIEKYRKFVQNERWVIEGNYSWLRPIIWERADAVIWLDYPFLFSFWRLWNRSVRRIVYKIPACNGNIETWRKLFLAGHRSYSGASRHASET